MRAALLLLAALAAAVGAAAAPSPPAPHGRPLEYESAERFFLRRGSIQPQAELFQRWQYESRAPFRSLMLGTYARVESRLKLGAFWRLQYGARRDDDWRRSPTGVWAWRDASERPEHVLVLDASPRVELKFLPGRWVGSVKARFERNFTDARNILSVEPELAWFTLDGLKPRSTMFLRHGTDFALNFGESRAWRRWWYLAGLWHFTPGLAAGPTVALRDEVWSTSPDFARVSPGQTYRVLHRSLIVGGSLVARWR